MKNLQKIVKASCFRKRVDRGISAHGNSFVTALADLLNLLNHSSKIMQISICFLRFAKEKFFLLLRCQIYRDETVSGCIKSTSL